MPPSGDRNVSHAGCAGRVVYMVGYSSGDPSKRLPGSMISNLTQLASIFFLAFLGYSVVTA